MGQKIHPTGFRLAVTRNWNSRWYANNRDFGDMLAEDIKVRDYLKTKLKNAAVSRVLIERPAKNARITIYSARPGVVIGKKGEDIEALKKELASRLGVPVAVNIEEVRKPEVDAQLIADSITQQLEKRIMYREGRVPLHTLRADIDYGFSEAKTTYGVIGVKVWVYKGDTLGQRDAPSLDSTPRPEGEERRGPRGPRRDGDRRPSGPGRGAPRGPGGGGGGGAGGGGRSMSGSTNVAPADGSDKPAEATAGAPEAPKSAVKRVPRKTGAAPAGTAPTDGKGE
jgi:small subunit ribosomal protein S3